MQITKWYSRFMDAVEKIVGLLLVISIVMMIGIMAFQAIMRYVFSAARPWCEELVVYACCYSTMLGAALAIRKANHLQVDILLQLYPRKVRCAVELIISVVMAAFFIAFTVYALSLCQNASGKSVTMPFITMRQVYYCFPIGGILIVLMSIEGFLKKLEELFSHKPADMKGVET